MTTQQRRTPPKKADETAAEETGEVLEAAEAAEQGAPAPEGLDEESRESEPPAEPEGDLCPGCYPDGWPAHAYSAGCEHGSYSRPDPRTRRP
jgi:hypothetical protein